MEKNKYIVLNESITKKSYLILEYLYHNSDESKYVKTKILKKYANANMPDICRLLKVLTKLKLLHKEKYDKRRNQYRITKRGTDFYLIIHDFYTLMNKCLKTK